MKASPRILVIATSLEPHRQAEALRAALGLTLRGGRIEVLVGALLSPAAVRAVATLRAFGHTVHERDVSAAIAEADAVEVWT